MPGWLIDANVWIAVSFAEHDHHALAKRFIAETSPECQALLCRATEQSWLRLLTTPALHRRKVWMDAYLAAFAIGHAVEFVTLDSDFKRFVKDGLKLKLLAT
ncbi:MAG: hypothetical protein MUF04_00490 [Akkermansiaceae bacterium]|nr:hypothetical protein [Akkermansiaceae bacterium]